MDAAKRKRLEEAGFSIGSAADFLGLSPERHEFVKIKVALSSAVRSYRRSSLLSQSQLAEKIGSSQSRVAKMEAGDASVSIDLMMSALMTMGMTRQELADVLAPERNQPVSVSFSVSLGKVSLFSPGNSSRRYNFNHGRKSPGPGDHPGRTHLPASQVA